MPLELRMISAAETRPLRQEVLRPHQPVAELVFPGDEESSTIHLGLYDGQRLVAVSSLYHEPPPGMPQEDAWRLRGVATLPGYRGQGLATQILRACFAHIGSQGGGLLWCNARSTAKGFYDRHGFETVGEAFELPGIGQHYRMQRRVTAG